MTEALMERITHYSTFPATPVSLRQMVQFGQNPSPGMFFSMYSGTRAGSETARLIA